MHHEANREGQRCGSKTSKTDILILKYAQTKQNQWHSHLRDCYSSQWHYCLDYRQHLFSFTMFMWFAELTIRFSDGKLMWSHAATTQFRRELF